MTKPWPRFAKGLPFKKIKIPNELLVDFQVAYNQARFNDIQNDYYYDPEYDKTVAGGSVAMIECPKPFYLRSTISPHIFTRWSKILQPYMEEWSGKELEFITGYGIRSYVKDSMLAVHRDEIKTHIISAIIHIDEHPDVKWPLDFVDHEGNHHQVTFERGEMLMYESLCVHAREMPFIGEYYRNMYFHWAPIDWDHTPYIGNRVRYKSIKEAQDEYRV